MKIFIATICIILILFSCATSSKSIIIDKKLEVLSKNDIYEVIQIAKDANPDKSIKSLSKSGNYQLYVLVKYRTHFHTERLRKYKHLILWKDISESIWKILPDSTPYSVEVSPKNQSLNSLKKSKTNNIHSFQTDGNVSDSFMIEIVDFLEHRLENNELIIRIQNDGQWFNVETSILLEDRGYYYHVNKKDNEWHIIHKGSWLS